MFDRHNLFTCNGCVGRFSEPHLAAIKSMSAEVDGLDAWDRRDLVRPLSLLSSPLAPLVLP